jgi:phospholipase/carboxylesterase
VNTHTTIGDLEVFVFQASSAPPDSAVILCHGFGAPGDDLVSLAPELVRHSKALENTRFYFPRGLIDLGFQHARAWWLLDMDAVQRLGRDPEALREFRRQEPKGMPAARAALLKLVRDVADSTKLPLKRIALGGFSQGAMLACDIALRTEEPLAGLAVLSGTLLIEDTWQRKAKARAGFHVFQAHGHSDPVLPFRGAELLRDLLTEAGLVVEFLPFPGGHTITLDALQELAGFLTTNLAAAAPQG